MGCRPFRQTFVMARGHVVTFAPKEGLDFAEFECLYRETVGMGVA